MKKPKTRRQKKKQQALANKRKVKNELEIRALRLENQRELEALEEALATL